MRFEFDRVLLVRIYYVNPTTAIAESSRCSKSLFCNLWRFYCCLVESMGGCSSIKIIPCQEENHYHDSIWKFIRVILFCEVILYCRMCPLVFSLVIITFVL